MFDLGLPAWPFYLVWLVMGVFGSFRYLYGKGARPYQSEGMAIPPSLFWKTLASAFAVGAAITALAVVVGTLLFLVVLPVTIALTSTFADVTKEDVNLIANIFIFAIPVAFGFHFLGKEEGIAVEK